MRYTQLRGLAQVTNWVKLKFAAMNLKKLATWLWMENSPSFPYSFIRFFPETRPTHKCRPDFFGRLVPPGVPPEESFISTGTPALWAGRADAAPPG